MLKEKVLEIAASEIGTEEVGNNWGSPTDPSDVDDFLRSVGINFPAPWCMAFVYWCFKEACSQIGIENPLAKTGGVLDQWNRRKLKYGQVHPMPGDVFIMDFGKGLGHAGFVEKVEGIWIYTIEGNSNDEGSREGYKVCRRRRVMDKIKGYLRFNQ